MLYVLILTQASPRGSMAGCSLGTQDRPGALASGGVRHCGNRRGL